MADIENAFMPPSAALWGRAEADPIRCKPGSAGRRSCSEKPRRLAPMLLTSRLALLCCSALVLLPCAAAAQGWNQPWSDPRDRPPRIDLSVTAGMIAPTDWSDLVVLGS